MENLIFTVMVWDFLEGDAFWSSVRIVPDGVTQLLVAVYLPVSTMIKRFFFGLGCDSGLEVGLVVGRASVAVVEA